MASLEGRRGRLVDVTEATCLGCALAGPNVDHPCPELPHQAIALQPTASCDNDWGDCGEGHLFATIHLTL